MAVVKARQADKIKTSVNSKAVRAHGISAINKDTDIGKARDFFRSNFPYMAQCDNVRHDTVHLPNQDINMTKYNRAIDKASREVLEITNTLLFHVNEKSRNFLIARMNYRLADGTLYNVRILGIAYNFIAKYPDWNIDKAIFISAYSVKKIKQTSNVNMTTLDAIEYIEHQQVEKRSKKSNVFLTDSMLGHYNTTAGIEQHEKDKKMSLAQDVAVERISLWFNNLRVDAKIRVMQEVKNASRYENFVQYQYNMPKNIMTFWANIQRKSKEYFPGLRYDDIAYLVINYIQYIKL